MHTTPHTHTTPATTLHHIFILFLYGPSSCGWDDERGVWVEGACGGRCGGSSSLFRREGRGTQQRRCAPHTWLFLSYKIIIMGENYLDIAFPHDIKYNKIIRCLHRGKHTTVYRTTVRYTVRYTVVCFSPCLFFFHLFRHHTTPYADTPLHQHSSYYFSSDPESRNIYI